MKRIAALFYSGRQAVIVGAGLTLLAGCVTPPDGTQYSSNTTVPPQPAQVEPAAQPALPPPSVPLHQPSQEEQLRTKLDLLRKQLAQSSYDWRIYSQIGQAFLELKDYRSAAAAFEQALTTHPITKTLDQERKAMDMAKARADAARAQQEQMRVAQETAAANAMMSGLMGSMSMMPGAGTMQNVMPVIEGMNRYNEGMAVAAATGAGQVNEETIDSSMPERQDLATIWINLALAQAGYGDYATAAASMERAYQIDPARHDALWRLAGIWREAGSPDRALSVMTRYLAFAPGKPNPQCCLMITEIFRSLGMDADAAIALDAAVKPLREAVAANPNDLTALQTLGNICNQGGLYDEAFKAFSAAYKQKPGDAAVINGLVVSELSLGKTRPDAELVGRMEAMAAASPNAAYSWYLIGRFQEESGNATAAGAAYRKSVDAWDASGAHGKVPGHVAVSYAGCGQTNKAAQCLDQLLDEQVGSSMAYIEFFRVGAVREKADNRPEQAIEYYSLCLDANPNYRPASLALQRIAARTEAAVTAQLAESAAALTRGDKAGAIASRAAAVALLPPGQKKDDLQREILRLAASTEKLPAVSAEGRAHWMRGNAIVKQAKSQKDVWRALLEYRQAIIQAPWQNSLRLNVAACYGMLGRYDDAIRETRLFLDGSPDAKAAEEARSRVYELEYQCKVARRELGALNPFR